LLSLDSPIILKPSNQLPYCNFNMHCSAIGLFYVITTAAAASIETRQLGLDLGLQLGTNGLVKVAAVRSPAISVPGVLKGLGVAAGDRKLKARENPNSDSYGIVTDA
jgi:hypothetical protein